MLVVAFLVDVLSDEGAQLLRILQRSRHLDRARPVHVVEALAVDQLLDHSFFQLRVAVGHLVVGRFHGASVALLGDEVELEVFANCLSVDQSA